MARDFARRSTPVNRHWTGFSTNAQAFGAGVFAATVSAAQHDRETLMRTRGTLLCYPDDVQAQGTLAEVSVGMVLVPEGTGATVLWSPLTDADAPWFWYTTFFVGNEETVTDVVPAFSVSGYREVIDSKAMRRSRNQEIQCVWENTTRAVAVSVNCFLAGRFLTQE